MASSSASTTGFYFAGATSSGRAFNASSARRCVSSEAPSSGEGLVARSAMTDLIRKREQFLDRNESIENLATGKLKRARVVGVVRDCRGSGEEESDLRGHGRL